MTREMAIKIWRSFGMTKTEAVLRRIHPQWFCDQVLDAAAEDDIDGFMALGILEVEPPSPPVAAEPPEDQGEDHLGERRDV